MKKHRNKPFFLGLTIITTLYLYYIYPLVLDAIWNYGFAKNISDGLIPYRDFNMIIPPLFHYITAIFILLFGNKLIIYYLIVSIMISVIIYISYQKIGLLSILLYMIIILSPHNGYNLLCLLLLFILLKILEKDKKNELLIATIISLMILTKHTTIVLIIPSILYAKSKKKNILIYLIACLSYILYLLINNNFSQFINYCILGMFDFTNKNFSGIDIFLILEIVICLIMLIYLIKDKFHNQVLFYIFMFQILAFPIVNLDHVAITIPPVLYYLFTQNTPYSKYLNYILAILIISYSISANLSIVTNKEFENYNHKNSFMNKKRISKHVIYLTDMIKEDIKKYPDYKIYIFTTEAYLIKLDLNIKIDKYDLINNGNMGYQGSKTYIKEIDTYCQKHKCAFLAPSVTNIKPGSQTNKEIIKYIDKKYKMLRASNILSFYVNNKFN